MILSAVCDASCFDFFYFCFWMNTVSNGEKQSSFFLRAVTVAISGAFWDENTWCRKNVDCISVQGKVKVSHNLMTPAKTCIFPDTQMSGFVFVSLPFSSRAFALSACVWSDECCLCIVLREEGMMASCRHRMLCHSRLFDITSCQVSLAARSSAPSVDGYVGQGASGHVVVGN